MGLDCDDVSTEGVRHLQSSSRTRLVDQPGATDIKSFWSKPKTPHKTCTRAVFLYKQIHDTFCLDRHAVDIAFDIFFVLDLRF